MASFVSPVLRCNPRLVSQCYYPLAHRPGQYARVCGPSWKTAASQSGALPNNGKSVADENALPTQEVEPIPEPEKSTWTRFRNFIFGGKLDKERIKALGLGAVISYGFISNLTYGTCVAITWGSHVAATGLTPFAAGQWGPFLARLAGFLALQHLLRPARFSCAVALTPVVDRMMSSLQKQFGMSKPQSFGVMFVGLAVLTLLCNFVALSAITAWNMPKV